MKGVLCVCTLETAFIACLHVLLNEPADVMVEKRECEQSTRKLKNDPPKKRRRKHEYEGKRKKEREEENEHIEDELMS